MLLKGEFTGERLFLQKPEVYRGIVALLAHGWGTQKIADTLEVSKNTVKAVRAREGTTLDAVKARISAEAFDLGADALEAAKIIVEEVMSNPIKRRALSLKDAKDLAVVGGVALQNGQLLSGAPTSRVEVTELPTPEHDAFNAYLAGLKKLPPTIDPAKVIDLPADPAMGLSGETRGQKEGAVAEANAADAAGTAPDARTAVSGEQQSEPLNQES